MEKTVLNSCDVVTVTNVDTGNANVLKQFVPTFFGMTNYRIRPHRTTSDHIVLHLTISDKTAQRRLQRPLTSCRSIPVVNHALAHSRKCLTYMKLGRPKKRWLDVVRSDCADMGRVMLFNASNARNARNARKLHYTLQSDSDVINASAVCSVLISYGL